MIRIKDKIASGLGSVLEWYDFAIYGFFAPLIAQLYFPSTTANTALLKTFAVFAVGFCARPIGALIFGHIADKHGRAISLKITPLLITIPTLFIAILPTYSQIGMLAPITLAILRIWQGICIGGEYATNIVYLCESSSKKNTYFLGSIGSCTGSFGIFLASTIASTWHSVFLNTNLVTWGWRLAFALSILIGIITYFMRKNIVETPTFKYNNDKSINPLIESYKAHKKEYLIAFGLTFLPATSFYYIFVFLPNYLSEMLHLSSARALTDNSISLFMRLLLIPVLGILADKVGGIKIARLSCILFLLFSFPLFYSLLHFPKTISWVFYIFAVFTTLNAATTPGLLIELLKPEIRCTILSFSFNVCFGVFGGLVPVISLALSQFSTNKEAPVFYLIFSAIITFIATSLFKKRHEYVS